MAGVLAAGVGLASGPLPAAAHEDVKTLGLMCIDHKFVKDGIAFFNGEDGPGEGEYDLVALAGASLAGFTPRRGRRINFASTFAALREQLLFAKLPPGKIAHPNIEHVVVLDHLGCGAYQNETGLPGEDETAQHRWVAERVGPFLTSLGLTSEFWLIKEPGVRPVKYPYR